MKVSERGLAEIASHEGIVISRYLDSKNIPTIGIGHTKSAGAPDPNAIKGELSIAEIMDIFAVDIAKFEKRVSAAFTRPLTQEQFDAAVSFDFNTGAIHKATWVKKFNAGDDAAARKGFMDWRKPKEIIPRREKERDLFFSGKYSSNGFANVYPAIGGKVQWGSGKRVNVLPLMNEPQKPAQTHKPIPAPAHPTDAKPAPLPRQQPKNGNTAKGAAIAVAGAATILATYWHEFTHWIGGLFQ